MECSNDGICVGSLCATGTNAETHYFQGQLQWLVHTGYPLSEDEVAQNYSTISDYISYFGYSVPGIGGGFHSDDDGAPGLPDGGDGGTNGPGGGGPSGYSLRHQPHFAHVIMALTSNQFYLTITNNATNAFVSICNTLSNITYEVLTNESLASTNWVVWQTLLATNSTTPAPPIALNSNAPLFFKAALVSSTCTNYSPPLPDWWAELYFNSTACVDPNANSSGDGIDNWDKYILGLNPNISYVSQLLISPPGGSYVSTPTITIFSFNGASIKYTTNGSIPNATNGITIASGVQITNLPSGNFTLKAWESGLTSVPATATYTIIPATPVFSIASGLYVYGTTLQVTCATSNAMVYYTTNGTDPTTNSCQIQATNVIALTTNVTIKAAAWLGTNESPIAIQNYIIQIPASYSPPTNDNFSNAIVLSGTSGEFSGTTAGATIETFETDSLQDYFWASISSDSSVWYQWTASSNGTVFVDCSKCSPAAAFFIVAYDFPLTNGPSPTNLVPAGYIDMGGYFGSPSGYPVDFGPNYYQIGGSAFLLTATQDVTYYFCACYVWGNPGPFDVSWEYVSPSKAPVFSPAAGTYSMPEPVIISDLDTNAVIYYTLTGVDPTTNDSIIVSGGSVNDEIPQR